MNILFIIGNYPTYGGAERIVTVLANEFVKRGHNIHICSYKQEHLEVAEKELSPSVILHKLSLPIISNQNIRILSNIVKTYNINIIFSHWASRCENAKLCRIACHGTNCEIVTLHHAIPNINNQIQIAKDKVESAKGFIRLLARFRLYLIVAYSRFCLRQTYNYSDMYIALSPVFIPIAQKFMWLKNSDKIRAIFNPITRDVMSTSFDNKQNEILYVGRIEYHQKKNYRILNIWEKIQDKHPDWNLTFVGDGPDRKDLEKRISEKKLMRVKVEGFKNPCDYYKRAKIIILTSASEGFPLVLGEAMAHGVVPIVLASFDAVYDIINNGSNGVIIPMPYNSNIYAKKLDELISKNDVEMEKLSKAALEKAKVFDLNSIVTTWESLFTELIKS